jgi:hypothetical protein
VTDGGIVSLVLEPGGAVETGEMVPGEGS